MERDPLESQGMSSEERNTYSKDESRSGSEDPRPSTLRPQVMPTAEIPSMSPRIREQALPEKKDGRFFDRWVVDKARGLGARAVKRTVLVKLREVVRAFAEWRSLRHAPAAERESVSDREIVASATATIQKAKTEAVRLDADAKDVERKAARRAAEAEEAEKAHSALPPALRGSKDWDIALTVLANLVVLRGRRLHHPYRAGTGARRHLVVKLDHFRAIGGSALTDTKIQVPENELGNTAPGDSAIPVTYVPFRNAHFLSVGVSWAESIGATAIYIGAVAEDSSGYPDCRPEYYRVFQELIRVGTRPETQIEMVTPVIAMKKSEIIQRGRELGAPLHLTWSCYQGEDLACGKCDSCLLRLRAFAEAGFADPIPYRGQTAGFAGRAL